MPMTSRGFGHSFCTYSGEMYFRNISSRVVDSFDQDFEPDYHTDELQCVALDLWCAIGICELGYDQPRVVEWSGECRAVRRGGPRYGGCV